MLNTSLCYIEKDDSYLMIHKTKKNDMNYDKWLGIGGKFSDYESPFDCARREILEESGLMVEKLNYTGIITFVSDEYGTEYMHLFTADEYSGNLKTECDEGVLEWVKKQDIYNLPIWEGDKIFFDLLEKNIPFFSLKLIYKGEQLIYCKPEY